MNIASLLLMRKHNAALEVVELFSESHLESHHHSPHHLSVEICFERGGEPAGDARKIIGRAHVRVNESRNPIFDEH
jgi:hypothetical protein